jgi:DNA primase
MKQQDNAEPPRLVVEGYMDVVALAQYDINYAVASLGTSTTPIIFSCCSG